VLRTFSRFSARQKGRRWRLVIVGTLSLDDEATYVDELRHLQPQLDIDVMVSPPRVVLRRLLLKSKIYVSAQGLDATPEVGPAAFTHSVSQVGTAISAGCVPVVFRVGAEAEFCEAHGLGHCFGDEGELAAALIEASACTDKGGLSESQRMRMYDLSPSAHAEAWARLVSRLDRDVEGAKGRPPALIVVGCHGSGTSAMARVLSLAGADLPADLTPPAVDNLTGFGECGAIADFNEAFLSSRGSGWDDAFTRRRFAKIAEADVHQAYQLLQANYTGDRPIVLKDPHISMLTALWDAAVRSALYQPKYIVMVRDPYEVAASLGGRSGFSTGKSLLLWAAYMRAVEKDTRAAERLFISYEDFIHEPMATLDRIATSLRVVFPRRRVAETRVSTFVKDSWPLEAVEVDSLSRVIDDYFRALRAACRGEPVAEAPGERLDARLEDFAAQFPPPFPEGVERWYIQRRHVSDA
jgi:hypothetical protein